MYVIQPAVRRNRQRGAAMVEAVVVIPFFLIIFASMIYAGHLYGSKIRTMRLAKQYAWTYAMNNCESGGGNVSHQDDGSAMDDVKGVNSNADDGPSHNMDKSGDQGMSKINQNMGTASSTVNASVTAGKEIGGFTKKLSTTTKVQCNEKPIDGDLFGLFKYGWNMWKQW